MLVVRKAEMRCLRQLNPIAPGDEMEPVLIAMADVKVGSSLL